MSTAHALTGDAGPLPRNAGTRAVAVVQEGIAPAGDGPAVDWSEIIARRASEAACPTEPSDTALLELAPIVLETARVVLRNTVSMFPWRGWRILQAATSPTVGTAELAALVAEDPRVAARVLLAAYELADGQDIVADVRLAVARVGRRQLAEMVAVAGVEVLTEDAAKVCEQVYPELWKELWTHAVTTCFSAGWLANRLGSVDVPTAVLGGLIHDVGKMVGLHAICLATQSGRIPMLPPETVAWLLRWTHIQIGTDVAGVQNFPDSIFIVCRMHHAEVLPAVPFRRELAVVVVASTLTEILSGNVLWDRSLSGPTRAARVLRLDQPYLNALATEVQRNLARAEEWGAFAR
jgi:HD-like signal output (HDOD) protein